MLKTWLFGEPPGNPVRTNAFVVAISGTTVFAAFETNLRRERQLEGIAKAKAAGAYKGWPPEGVARWGVQDGAARHRPTPLAGQASAPTHGVVVGQFAVIQSVAPSVGVEMIPISLGDVTDIEREIEAFARSANGGLIVAAGTSGVIHRNLSTNWSSTSKPRRTSGSPCRSRCLPAPTR
jgi:hypothetical protein